MRGPGATRVVCRSLGRRAILCDASEDYIRMTEKRLNIQRVELELTRA
jgi:DNA modification methylase